MSRVNAWLDNFVTYASANLASLGLVAGDLTPVTTAQTAWNTAYQPVEKAPVAACVSAGRRANRVERAITAGEDAGRYLVDPTHDFFNGLLHRPGRHLKT